MIEVIYSPRESFDISNIELSISVEEYNEKTLHCYENITYHIVSGIVTRTDETFFDADEEEIFSLLSVEDLYWLEKEIISEYKVRGGL